MPGQNRSGGSTWSPIKAAKQAAEDKGGIISMGPHQVRPAKIVIGTDPQGVEFALVGGE
jgi:predicted enzyme related to lactoylglutathione lyase